MRLAAIALLLGLLSIAGGIGYHLLNEQRQAATQPAPAAPEAEPPKSEMRRLRVDEEPPGPRQRSLEKAGPSDGAPLRHPLVQKMQTASFAFNHPDVLYLARRAQITLTLAEGDRAALEALERQFDQAIEGTVQAGTTKVAPIMTATLVGRSFRIEPAGEQPRAVLLKTQGPVEWTWFVEPLEPGQGKLLRLNLYASVDQPGQGSAPVRIKTFEARINVDVRAWDRIIYEARRMTPISQALTGLGGLVAFGGFLVTLYRWLRP
jgi:hypothetical protein